MAHAAAELPNYKTVHRRFQTWCRDEVLRRVLTGRLVFAPLLSIRYLFRPSSPIGRAVISTALFATRAS
jgi:hypothetical protein